MEDWAEIRRLHRPEGVRSGRSPAGWGPRGTRCARALTSERPPQYERKPRGSVADAYEPQIQVLLAEWPKMPAPVIAERIGWPYLSSPLKKKLQKIRPEYVGIDPVDRFVYRPGRSLSATCGFPHRRSRSVRGKTASCRCW